MITQQIAGYSEVRINPPFDAAGALAFMTAQQRVVHAFLRGGSVMRDDLRRCATVEVVNRGQPDEFERWVVKA